MSTYFAGSMLILFLLLPVVLRIFFREKVRLDSIVLLVPFSIIAVILYTFAFGLQAYTIMLYTLIVIVYLANFRALQRFRNQLFIDNYHFYFCAGCVIQFLIIVFMGAIMIIYMPEKNTDISFKPEQKVTVKKETIPMTGNTWTGLSESQSFFAKPDAVFYIYEVQKPQEKLAEAATTEETADEIKEQILETENETASEQLALPEQAALLADAAAGGEQPVEEMPLTETKKPENLPVIVYLPDVCTTVQDAEPLLYRLAKAGYTVLGADMNVRDIKYSDRIPGATWLRPLYMRIDKRRNPESYKQKESVFAEKKALELRLLRNSAEKLFPGKKFLLLADKLVLPYADKYFAEEEIFPLEKDSYGMLFLSKPFELVAMDWHKWNYDTLRKERIMLKILIENIERRIKTTEDFWNDTDRTELMVQ